MADNTTPVVPPAAAPAAAPGAVVTLKDGTQLDGSVVKVMHAIRGLESTNNYTESGDNGTSLGAYQWNNGKTKIAPGALPVNFVNAAKQYGLDPTDFSPANQNKVAYAQIKAYKDQGLSPNEIDALWNGAHKDANGKYVHNSTTRATQFKNALAQVAGIQSADASTGDDGTTAPAAPAAPTAFDNGQTAIVRPNLTKYTDVTFTPAEKAQQIAGYNADTAKLQDEAKKDSSFGGMLKNTLKGIGNMFTSSEQGLGQSIATVFGSGKNLDTYTGNVDTLTTGILQTKKLIDQYTAKGDTANANKFKKVYNSQLDQLNENYDAIDKINGDIPTAGKVLGQAGGVVLDALSAGTYGTAAKGAETGTLLTKEAMQATAKKAAQEAATVAAKKAAESGTENTAVKAAGTIFGGPTAGRVLESASKPTGIGTKAGLANVAKGAGLGYATDVSQGLQGNRGQDREGLASLIPGANTVFGAAIPALTETGQSVANKLNPEIKATKLIDSRKTELESLDGYKSVQKVVQKNKDRGIDVKDLVSTPFKADDGSTIDLLHGAVDKNGTINTKGEGNAIDTLQQHIKPAESVVSDNLKKEGVSIPLSTVQKKLTAAVDSSGLEGAALMRARNEVTADIKGYKLRANEDGTIPLYKLHDAKVDKYSNINFMTEPEKQKSAKSIASALKALVEDNTKSINVKATNKELSKYYAVIDYLDKLDGKKVEGGRLGKYFAKTVGAMVGGHFGPLGAIAGAEAAGAIKGAQFKTTFGRPGTAMESMPGLQRSAELKQSIFNGKSREVPVKSNLEFNRGTGASPKLVPVIPTATRRVPVQTQPQFSRGKGSQPRLRPVIPALP